MIASTDYGQDTRSKPVEDEHSECSGLSRSTDRDPLGAMVEDFAELCEYLLHYLEARKDKTKAAVRRLIIVSVILITTGIAWVAALAAGAVLLVRGMAEAAAIAIGNRFWAGQIIVGSSIVLSTLLVISLLTVLSNHSARQRTIQKYERRHRIQRARFGENAKRRSAS